jgi:hypothetical protein
MRCGVRELRKGTAQHASKVRYSTAALQRRLLYRHALRPYGRILDIVEHAIRSALRRRIVPHYHRGRVALAGGVRVVASAPQSGATVLEPEDRGGRVGGDVLARLDSLAVREPFDFLDDGVAEGSLVEAAFDAVIGRGFARFSAGPS